MGYYTNHKIIIENDENETILNELIEIVGYDPFDDDCKWYEEPNDMKLISKRYPNVLFTLNGEGEESFDIWVKYYKNGKCQECIAELTFDKFDESKLK